MQFFTIADIGPTQSLLPSGTLLARRALAGDVDTAIQRLYAHDFRWREAIDPVREAEGR